MIRVASYQPYFLPFDYWFARLAESDLFIMSDELQFNRNHWYHRTTVGERKFTIPVWHTKHGTGDPLREKRISYADHSYERMTEELCSALTGRPYSEIVVPMVREELVKAPEYLIDLNLRLIRKFLDYLGLAHGRRIFLGSVLKPEGRKGDRIFNIMKTLTPEGSEYICGQFGWGYIDHEKFKAHGYSVRQQSWTKTEYDGNINIADLCTRFSRDEVVRILGGQR